ncbi:MAG: response regulator transcription factor [Mariprofundales bacterium]
MSIHSIRILLADDHPVVRMGYHQLLNSAPDMNVEAEASTGEEAYQIYQKLLVDVVIMDISMPGIGGMSAARRILEFNNRAQILLLSMYDSSVYPSRAMKFGVKGYVTKQSSADTLIQGVRLVARGRSFISPDVVQKLALSSLSGSSDPIDVLTPREFEVFSMLADGHAVKDIYPILHLSPKTVETHRANIMNKLSVRNVAELAHIAIRWGIVDA